MISSLHSIYKIFLILFLSLAATTTFGQIVIEPTQPQDRAPEGYKRLMYQLGPLPLRNSNVFIKPGKTVDLLDFYTRQKLVMDSEGYIWGENMNDFHDVNFGLREAYAVCQSFGMRVPTLGELVKLYESKGIKVASKYPEKPSEKPSGPDFVNIKDLVNVDGLFDTGYRKGDVHFVEQVAYSVKEYKGVRNDFRHAMIWSSSFPGTPDAPEERLIFNLKNHTMVLHLRDGKPRYWQVDGAIGVRCVPNQ